MIEKIDIDAILAKATPISRAEISPFYEVDEDGTVWSIRHNWRGYGRRQITSAIDDEGYLSVRLSLPGRRRIHLPVHRLVALFHLPARPSADHEIRHLDGDRMNPSAANLAWGTALENAADRHRHGNTARGERNGFAKLSAALVVQIRASSESSYALAEKFGVDPKTIQLARSRATWGHVP